MGTISNWSATTSWHEVCARAAGRHKYNSWRTFLGDQRRAQILTLLVELGGLERGAQAAITRRLGVHRWFVVNQRQLSRLTVMPLDLSVPLGSELRCLLRLPIAPPKLGVDDPGEYLVEAYDALPICRDLGVDADIGHRERWLPAPIVRLLPQQFPRSSLRPEIQLCSPSEHRVMCPTPPTGTFRWQPRIVFWKFHAVSS